jgi:hypothetical protein
VNTHRALQDRVTHAHRDQTGILITPKVAFTRRATIGQLCARVGGISRWWQVDALAALRHCRPRGVPAERPALDAVAAIWKALKNSA